MAVDWYSDYGKHEKGFNKAAESGFIAHGLSKKPNLTNFEAFYLNAFYQLSEAPQADKLAFCILNNITMEEFKDIEWMINYINSNKKKDHASS